ncbi:class A beta-lactamase [Qipengyuania sp. ASV99]|uniref:class A beta-lactamase n=1 Tax=Qipengyuania sp. ASV99 TaxID=3399681 RepID=UPI003A4C56F2
MSIDRRSFVGGSLASGIALTLPGCVPIDQSHIGRVAAALRIIEANSGGTLGAEFYDTGSGFSTGLNRQVRFGHASSFKLSLAAWVLTRDARFIDDGGRTVRWSESELLSNSPFTRERLQTGATLIELARAVQVQSDNTAANVLLRETGGPETLNAYWRSIGDTISRLDRLEPELNNVPPAEDRDTTTPAAMARTIAKLVTGFGVPESRQATLKEWMVETATGLRRVRAGLPESWRAGDKTGTSTWPGMGGGLFVDIGFVEPVGGSLISFAVYYRTPEQTQGVDPQAEAVLAQVGRVLAQFARVQIG